MYFTEPSSTPSLTLVLCCNQLHVNHLQGKQCFLTLSLVILFVADTPDQNIYYHCSSNLCGLINLANLLSSIYSFVASIPFEFSFFLQKQLEFVEQLLKSQALAVVHIDIIYIWSKQLDISHVLYMLSLHPTTGRALSTPIPKIFLYSYFTHY